MIWATGDCHGNFERFKPEYFPEQAELTKEDIIIICGDFGGVWFGDSRDDEALDWLERLPFTLAFVDGNHENYDAIESYHVEEWHGGKIQRIRPHVLHLMRGQIFELEGYRFFTMGGARSHDIEDGILELNDPNFERKLLMMQRKPRERFRINHISWWQQEKSAAQIKNLAESLDLFDFAPGVHTSQDYGKYMIQQSGRFEYDENLDAFYDYEKYGTERMNEEDGMFTDRGYIAYKGYTRELRSMGIPVIFEEQNINSIYPESEFLITIHGAFAQSESEGISSRVKWGKHQAMRTGKANIQYKTLLGYEKGPDGEMVVNAEQAETVRKIYELYLSGQTLRNIKETLETGGFKNAAGTTEWTTSNLRTILSDEKYCGDVLLQKTFIRDCISKQVIRNTGQLPMYLIQNHHEAIIPRERFDAVQMELARRRAQTGGTKKSAPTGMSRYSGKYALSGLLFCGECGTAYRRVVWTQHGEKRAVWRCSSRLDYGKKYCKESPTLDESPLQQAVLAAINASMSGRKVLANQLVDAMEQELAPVPGESMSLGDIERAVTELGKQFDTLLAEAANGDADDYAERFRAISTTMEELKRRKAAILSIRQEQEQISRRIHAAASAMTAVTMGITEWDDGVVYQMLEKVTVLAGNRIKVTFRNGVEIEQSVDQPKRRKFA